MSEPNTIIIQASDDEMHHLCIGEPRFEVLCHIIYARKNNYPSREDFLEKALAFLDSEEDMTGYADNYSDEYGCSECTEVKNPVRTFEFVSYKARHYDTGYEEKPKTFVIDNIVSIINIGLQRWTNHVQLIETETDYIFSIWYTNA